MKKLAEMLRRFLNAAKSQKIVQLCLVIFSVLILFSTSQRADGEFIFWMAVRLVGLLAVVIIICVMRQQVNWQKLISGLLTKGEEVIQRMISTKFGLIVMLILAALTVVISMF